jgi:hypothetical protein
LIWLWSLVSLNQPSIRQVSVVNASILAFHLQWHN